MLKVKTSFETFEKLFSALEEFQRQHNVQLWVRDSRTVSAAAKRARRKNLNPALKYAELTYSCVFGGRKPSDASKVHNQTSAGGCPFKIRLSTSSDGQYLVVKEINNTHNHEPGKKLHETNRPLNKGQKGRAWAKSSTPHGRGNGRSSIAAAASSETSPDSYGFSSPDASSSSPVFFSSLSSVQPSARYVTNAPSKLMITDNRQPSSVRSPFTNLQQLQGHQPSGAPPKLSPGAGVRKDGSCGKYGVRSSSPAFILPDVNASDHMYSMLDGHLTDTSRQSTIRRPSTASSPISNLPSPYLDSGLCSGRSEDSQSPDVLSDESNMATLSSTEVNSDAFALTPLHDLNDFLNEAVATVPDFENLTCTSPPPNTPVFDSFEKDSGNGFSSTNFPDESSSSSHGSSAPAKMYIKSEAGTAMMPLRHVLVKNVAKQQNAALTCTVLQGVKPRSSGKDSPAYHAKIYIQKVGAKGLQPQSSQNAAVTSGFSVSEPLSSNARNSSLLVTSRPSFSLVPASRTGPFPVKNFKATISTRLSSVNKATRNELVPTASGSGSDSLMSAVDPKELCSVDADHKCSAGTLEQDIEKVDCIDSILENAFKQDTVFDLLDEDLPYSQHSVKDKVCFGLGSDLQLSEMEDPSAIFDGICALSDFKTEPSEEPFVPEIENNFFNQLCSPMLFSDLWLNE